MSDVIDLDALEPQSRVVKYKGQEITINPPKTANVLRLGFLGQKMTSIEDASPEEVEKIVSDLTKEVKDCIPELGDSELNTNQLLTLVGIITEMGMPNDAKELKAKGITPNTPKVNP